MINDKSIRAGYLVNAKIAKIQENGFAMSFLGGMQGTVFADHIPNDMSRYKVGERLKARIISHDPITKSTALSLLPHIADYMKVEL